METQVLSNSFLEVKKSVHLPKYLDENFGWAESSSYFTIEEVEKLWLLIPHLLEEMRAAKEAGSEKKIKDLERQLSELKGHD